MVTPWLEVAETYLRTGELTTGDWVSAVGSTVSAAVNVDTPLGQMTANIRPSNAGRNLIIGGVMSAFGDDAARSFLESAVGQEVGNSIGGGLADITGLRNWTTKADAAFIEAARRRADAASHTTVSANTEPGPEEIDNSDLLLVQNRRQLSEEETRDLERLAEHSESARELIKALQDPAERERLLAEYCSDGLNSVMGSVLGEQPFYGPLGRMLGIQPNVDTLIARLELSAQRTTSLAEGLDGALVRGETLPNELRAVLTGDVSGLSRLEGYRAIDLCDCGSKPLQSGQIGRR
jgi:hypothetical protein